MQNMFTEKEGIVHCEDVSLELLAKRYGTPLFVYSLNSIKNMVTAYQEAFRKFSPIVAYAIKANPNLSILREAGLLGAGADIVSGGELHRAIDAGIPTNKIVFAGVGKSHAEIEAALAAEILIFNVESIPELKLLDSVAGEMNLTAHFAIRVNPDVDPRTHAYISTGKKESKFGLDIKTAIEAYRLSLKMKNVEALGIHCHIGSQITKTNPFVQAIEKVVRVIREVRELGASINYLDIGGGLGIDYDGTVPPTPSELANVISPFIEESGCKLIIEPGRSIVGNSGVLLTRVHYIKETPIHRYVIVDAAMNDLIRPAFYDAFHSIEHIDTRQARTETVCEIVGPICETGDFLAKGRKMPLPASGDILMIRSAGAYGMAMSSNYNQRTRAAEILVDKNKFKLVRRRETYADLSRTEKEIEDEWNN